MRGCTEEKHPWMNVCFSDELIQAIRHDIHSADQLLESAACQEYFNHSFFHQ